MPVVPTKHKTNKTTAAGSLVNRGGAGLLKKVEKPEGDAKRATLAKQQEVVAAVDKIADAILHLAVPISQLMPDPSNARLHPERNLQAIRDSLSQYGQVKPIVVRKETNIIVAGNGTYEAAKTLGWTKLAASLVEMSEAEATGYGLADNRTAELAKWDFEVVARLDKLLQESGQASIGWSLDELEVLRAADWTPPPVDETAYGSNGEAEGGSPLLISFTPDEYEAVGAAINRVRDDALAEDRESPSDAQCIQLICTQWIEKE